MRPMYRKPPLGPPDPPDEIDRDMREPRMVDCLRCDPDDPDPSCTKCHGTGSHEEEPPDDEWMDDVYNEQP